MFSIGQFARHGRVSVRMLRHYDQIGLLRPACVDPATGYRSYQGSQLTELNRVIALRELGFGLGQIQQFLSEGVGLAELRGMLLMRRAEIQAQIQTETRRLARVEARLATLEHEAHAPVGDVVVKALPPVRVGELTGTAAGYEPQAINPVIHDLYCELWQRLDAAGVAAAGPALAYYEDTPDEDGLIVVHATVPVSADVSADVGAARGTGAVNVVSLPPVECAASVIHRGSMDTVLSTIQALAFWMEANGYQCAGYAREITLEWSPDPGRWVTELQQPVLITSTKG